MNKMTDGTALTTEVGGVSQPQAHRFERLSVPVVRKATSRRLTPPEVAAFRRVADVLIKSDGENLGGGELEGYEDLLHEALAIVDPDLVQLPELVRGFDDVPEPDLYGHLKEMSSSEPKNFAVLSTLIAAVYLYSPQIEAKHAYPHPHRNPIDINQIADELETGILDSVMERGSIFVPTNAHE